MRERPEDNLNSIFVIVQSLVFLTLLIFLASFAFSPSVANEIRRRAGNRSQISGKSLSEGYFCECAHLNHSRDYTNYDNPTNGVYVTIEEHYLMHRYFHENNIHFLIGLTREQNFWALHAIAERMRELYSKRPDLHDDKLKVNRFIQDRIDRMKDEVYSYVEREILPRLRLTET